MFEVIGGEVQLKRRLHAYRYRDLIIPHEVASTLDSLQPIPNVPINPQPLELSAVQGEVELIWKFSMSLAQKSGSNSMFPSSPS